VARPGTEIMAALAVGIILVILASATPAVASHDKTDVVTTDDGSTIFGEIKSVLYATLSFDSDAIGLISIEWRHVTGMTSKFEYRVELSDDSLYYGSLGQPELPGHLSIVTADGPVEVDLAEVASIVPVEHGFWRAVDGSVNFGLTYTQASSAFQYNFNAETERRARRYYSALSAQSIFNTQQDAETTSQHYLKFFLTQITKRNWGPFEMAQLQSNPDQGYDLRLLIGGGATDFLIESSRKFLALNLGVVYNREDVTDESQVNESAEAMAGVAFRRYKRGSHSPNIQLSWMTFVTLDDSHRFRNVLNFNIGWKIVGDFKFNFQVNNSYDSQPPGENENKNDVSVVTSVGYTF
jgi:hypothetical protein